MYFSKSVTSEQNTSIFYSLFVAFVENNTTLTVFRKLYNVFRAKPKEVDPIKLKFVYDQSVF